MSEKTPTPRPHEKTTIVTTAEHAKRIAPHIQEYAAKLAQHGLEYVDMTQPELGCREIGQPVGINLAPIPEDESWGVGI